MPLHRPRDWLQLEARQITENTWNIKYPEYGDRREIRVFKNVR